MRNGEPSGRSLVKQGADARAPLALSRVDALTTYKVDTIGVHARSWWPSAIAALCATLPDPVSDCRRRGSKPKPGEPTDKPRWGTVWDLHHPTEATRLLLASWQCQGWKFSVSRVDVARDERMRYEVRGSMLWLRVSMFYIQLPRTDYFPMDLAPWAGAIGKPRAWRRLMRAAAEEALEDSQRRPPRRA